MADPNAPTDPNPFDQIDPQTGGMSGQAAPDDDNPFDAMGPRPQGQSGLLGTLARGAAKAVAPVLGSFPAVGAGAELGAAALGGPETPAGLVGGFVGGAVGGLVGQAGIEKAQDYMIKQLPDSWQDALGLSDRQARVDEMQHPYASIAAGVAPFLLTNTPFAAAKALADLPKDATAMQRVMANPVTQKLFGGALMGGMQLGQEEVEGEKPDWTSVAVATGMGMFLNRPTKLGETLEAAGAAPFRRPVVAPAPTPTVEGEPPPTPAYNFGPGWLENPDVDHSAIQVGTNIVHTNTLDGLPESGTVTAVNPLGPEYPGYSFQSADGNEGFTPRDQVVSTLEKSPTIAQAANVKVMGPGINEAVSNGELAQSPDTEQAATAGAALEQSVTTKPTPDLHVLVRQRNPELFAEYDDLTQRQDDLRAWIDQQKAPSPDDIQAAQDALDYAKGRMESAPRTANRKVLQTLIDQAQAHFDDLTSRGPDTETPGTLAARQEILENERRLGELSQAVRGAYEGAAAYAGTETVPIAPPAEQLAAPVEQSAVSETTPAQPVPLSIPDQRGAIARDATQRWIAAGRPQDEAETHGALEAAMYVAHAADIGRQPLELYEAEKPSHILQRDTPLSKNATERMATPRGAPLMPTKERPAIAPEPAVRADAGTETAALTFPEPEKQEFTTAKGSTYEVHEDGTTTRNKSYHPEHGAEDVGIKPRSEKTIYVDKNAADLSAAGLSEGKYRLALKNGKAYLLSWNEKEGKWGVFPATKDGIPYSETPEVGKYPIEAWGAKDDVPGYEAYSGQHAGNEIVGVRGIEPTRPSTGGEIQSLDPATIGVDANRFQFKEGGDAEGVTDRLQGITEWDPRLAGTVLVYRDGDGKNWIADGHQRLGLAKRLAETQPGIRLNAFVLNAAEGVTDADARVIAAAKNIAEGTGTPVDAAKIMREAKTRKIKLPPLPPRSALAREGKALANLSPDAFGMVVNDVIPTNQAAIVGRLVTDPATQVEALRVLAKAKPDNIQQAELIVRDILSTGTEARTVQGGLFGDEHFAASAVLERAKIADEALKMLRRDRAVFSTLTREAERIQSEGANSLDTAANQNRLTADEQAAQLFNQLATRRGPVSDELTAIARRLQSGEISKAEAGREFVGIIRRSVESGVAEGGNAGGTEFGAERELAQDEGQTDLFQGANAKITTFPNARSIIQLFKTTNASSPAHELAHDWLERILRNAKLDSASSGLKANADGIRRWLKIKGDTITDAQHERFARSFETYLREGHAPTRDLVHVFERFKNWLTQIYQALKSGRVQGLPAINEETRLIFDRMLSQNPERAIIAREREKQPSIADIHEQDAAETSAKDAEPVGDRAKGELDRYVTEQPEPIAGELGRSTAAIEPTGEAGASPSGTGEVEQGGSGPATKSGSGASSEKREQERGGDNATLSEGNDLFGSTGSGPRSISKPSVESIAPRPHEPVTDDGRIYANNVRVENLTSVPEFQEAIVKAYENDVAAGTYKGDTSTLTPGELLDLANTVGLDPATITASHLAEMFGGYQGLPQKVLALRMALRQSASTIATLAKTYQANLTDETLVPFAQAIARHDMMMSTLSRVTKVAGRTLGMSFRNLDEMGGRDLNQMLKDSTGRDLFQMKKLAKAMSAMDDTAKISGLARDSQARSWGRGFVEFFINNLISGLATHVTYAIANGLTIVQRNAIEAPLAEYLGQMRGARGGSQVIPIGEARARLRGLRQGLAGSVKATIETAKIGSQTALPGETSAPSLPYTPSDFGIGATFNPNATWRDVGNSLYGLFQGAFDGIRSVAALGKAGGDPQAPAWGWQFSPNRQTPDLALKGVPVLPVGTLVTLPSRMTATVHTFFRCMNYSAEINAQAIRQAALEGLKGAARDARVDQLRASPTQDMMDKAIEASNDLTLIGQGGKWTQKLSEFTNLTVDLPLLGETPILKFIDPFTRIGMNVFTQGLVERTPLGAVISPEIRADLLSNDPQRADTAAAKMLAGSALALTFGMMAASGVVNGSGPSDPKKRAVWQMAGNLPHSVKMGNFWYQYSRLGSLGMLAGVAADLYDVAHAVDQGDATTATALLAHAFTQNILDASFMSGPSQLIDAIDRGGSTMTNYVQNFLGAFVPYSVGMAQLDRATDPYSRQVRSIMDEIKSKIPGQSETLSPRWDIWGQPMPNLQALAPGLTALYYQRISTDPVNIALSNLGVGIGPVNSRIRGITLNQQQYDDYARIAGRMTKMRLDALVNSPAFRTMNPGTQHDTIDMMVTQCRDTASEIMLMKYPQIAVEAARLKMSKAQGATQ